jgi:hypothetical protein
MRRRAVELLAVAGAVAGGAALAIALRCRDDAPPIEPAPACPELAGYSPEIVNRPIAELQHALLGVMSPAMVRDQLAAIRSKLEQYRPERRECMYRVMLIGMAPTPHSPLVRWGIDRPSGELEQLYLRIETDPPRSEADRRRVLGFVDSAVGTIAGSAAADEHEWWRREYLGMVITCQASRSELATLGARRPRPQDCPNNW